ncbi:MAG: hypothetical protein K8T90_03205 [Planctomycetes bacterium]|nr:hypothetical protein [Planctomycetota bacterium]
MGFLDRLTGRRDEPRGDAVAPLVAAVVRSPEDAAAHLALGRALLADGRVDAALAVTRSAHSLGAGDAAAFELLARAWAAAGHVGPAADALRIACSLGADGRAAAAAAQAAATRWGGADPLVRRESNTYHRVRSLADHLTAAFPGDDSFSVLDVGGGLGLLCQFLPRARYCLVEPSVNGLSSPPLPFAPRSFDAVVSCHVFEHVPPTDREAFLDALCAAARRRVVLLNPFHEERTSPEERLRLVIELTDAKWAKEHLSCSLPKPTDVLAYAERRGLRATVSPNSGIAAGLALYFAGHYARLAGRDTEWARAQEFFNTRLRAATDHVEFPAALLVDLELPA